MNLDRALAISDYQCDERTAELRWLAEQARGRQLIAELGSFKGATTRAMADNTSGKVYAIDTFAGSVGEVEMSKLLASHEEGWLRKTFEDNMSGLSNVIIIQEHSLKAAEECSMLGIRFDMIFIDASHDYDSVRADILAWLPLLTLGGLFCGHDRQWDGVSQAINELVPQHRVGAGAIWYRPEGPR